MFSSFGDHHRGGKYDDDGDDDDNSDYGKYGKGGGSTLFEQMMIKEMMDEITNNPQDPHEEDIGIFMEEGELDSWWDGWKEKLPEIFSQDSQPYKQYSFGTKLMAYFDNDPNKPMRVQILGSKMFPDWQPRMVRTGIDEYQTKTPYYIVKSKGSNYRDLQKVDYMTAHAIEDPEVDDDFEEPLWRRGWGESDNEVDRDFEELVEIAEANKRKKMQAEEDDNGVAVLDHNHNIPDWNASTDGSFGDAFWNASLSPNERLETNRRDVGPFYSDDNLTLRKLILKLALCWTDDKAGGVILTNERRTKFQVIEYYGPKKNNEGQPLIDIQYANSPSRRDAELFLRGEEIRFIICSDSLARKVENHIMQTALGQGLNDIGSGLLLFEARLVPMRPTFSIKDNNSGKVPDLHPKTRLSDGTFGVEFELSCAIGTQQEGVGRSLQKHAGVTVKLQERKFTKPGFRYLYLCSQEQVTGQEWTLCHDGSIETNPDWANSSKFELVSPILSGDDGLDECRRVLNTVTDTSAIQINTSMGMHVHIGVPNIEFNELKSICQNFVLYEDVMDSFLGRTNNKYCKSNRQGVDTWRSIALCQTMEDLFPLMNPNGRYHKLNLDNLRTGKRPTIEFRQHSANSDATKAEAWIRFCMALVNNSRSTVTIMSRTEGTNSGYEDLFDRLIRDDGLKEFYRTQRRS